METRTTDLLIIGGGINGTGIAADAAGRGLSVILCEQDDLASATSSWSTKLIHGGLRYLENYEFKLVREALIEQTILLKKAPFIIHPMKFILPYETHLRPAWMIRLGLFLYDHLAKRSCLPYSGKLNFNDSLLNNPLKSKFKMGFYYFDCQTDDARLVILNAMAAKQRGATILTRTICQKAYRENGYWKAKLIDQHNNQVIPVTAKAIVNATGPWTASTLKNRLDRPVSVNVNLVKGSHIVVPALYPENSAYILQNDDDRIIFAIPYQQFFTLIGTTEVPFHNDPKAAKISEQEIHYLCQAINRYFKSQISQDKIVWSYSGVRPLHDGQQELPAKITRDYRFAMETEAGKAPVLSIFGGKITTFRILAEEAVNQLKTYFPWMKPAWTANSPLPGGDLQGLSFDGFVKQLKSDYCWLDAKIVERYARSYGSLTYQLLNDAHSINDMGHHFGQGLYEREILYWRDHEWAQTLTDIIWRRSKLGLILTIDEQKNIQTYLKNNG